MEKKPANSENYMTERNKQIIKLFIRFLVTTGLLIWVFSQIDFKQFSHAIKTARWQYLIAVWVLTIILFWIRSIKMRVILKKQDCDVNANTIFGATVVTALYSMVLPGVLSTAVKWHILNKNTGKSSKILSSMLYNQVSITVTMMVYGLAALIITNPSSLLMPDTKNRWLLPIACGLLLATILAISLLLLNSRTGGIIISSINFLFRPLPETIRQKIRNVFNQIMTFHTVGAGFHLKIVSMTTIDTLIGSFIIYVLSAKAANITAPIGIFVWLCAIIYVLGRVPVSVANLGVREMTLVGMLALYGVEKSQALLMSMILFSALVIMAAIGAIYQLYWAVIGKKPNNTSNQQAE